MTFNNFIRLCISTGIFLILINALQYIQIITSRDVQKAKQELGIFHEHESVPTLSLDTQIPELSSASGLRFYYSPTSLQNLVPELGIALSTITASEPIRPKISRLNIELYRDMIDVRGKMKQEVIKLFGVSEIPDRELVGVFVHELSHYIDIYFLEKKVFRDPSQEFYDISWKSTNTIIGGQKNKDFVSGYAMTNKYEDFAESMTYYMFANEEMREKSKNSFSLKQKYEFFEKNIFKNGTFKDTDFSETLAQRYYWDITKKPFEMKKFLEYIDNAI